MDPWTVAAVVLCAVLVGAGLPLLVEARSTLRVVHRVADRLDHATARLEANGRVEEVAATIDALTHAARKASEGIRLASVVAAALGPAAAAAVQAWRAAGADPGVAARPPRRARAAEGPNGAAPHTSEPKPEPTEERS